ncbi:type I restriction enzyme, partial [Bifidobacterium longum]
MNLAISEDAKHRNEKLVISGNCHCPPSFRYSRLSMIRQTSRKYASAWEQRKLENLASFGGGHTPSMADASNYVDGKILWVTSQDVKQHYIENTTTMISEKGAATLTLYPSDSIVIVARSGILRHTIPVAKLRKPATVNQDIKVIQTVDSCDSSWLLQYFIASNKT